MRSFRYCVIVLTAILIYTTYNVTKAVKEKLMFEQPDLALSSVQIFLISAYRCVNIVV